MNHFRLRGTWEEDPAPIPFPREVAGRDAGTDAQSPASEVKKSTLSDRTRELITNIDQDLDRLQIKFDEYTHLLDSDEEAGNDGPSAA